MHTITAQQSRDARRELGLSQANVTKELNFNRQYLSEFETGFSTRLTETQLKKLRTFYETKISEANESGGEITLIFGEPQLEPPTISIENKLTKRLTFQVADEVSNETLNSTLEVINDNDERLFELLSTTIVRDEALFELGTGKLSQDTLRTLRSAFTHLSINYLLIRALTGWPKLGLSAGDINPATDSILKLIIDDTYEWFQHFENHHDQENETDHIAEAGENE